LFSLKYAIVYITIVINRSFITSDSKGINSLFYYKCYNVHRKVFEMEAVAMTFLGIQERIWTKLTAAGATSIERAVTVQEAHLDMQEQNWLNYIAGGLFARVKKTQDKRYYTADHS